MAKRTTKKKFTITARFDIWVEKTVEADNLEAALGIAQSSTFDDFIEGATVATEIIDTNRLSGTGVREEWN